MQYFLKKIGLISLFFVSFSLAGTAQAAEETNTTSKIHIIEIRDFEFVPKNLTVRLGDQVRWVNKDIAPHTATATDSGKSFNSSKLSRDEGWAFTATSSGVTPYICAFHPLMKGTITVKD